MLYTILYDERVIERDIPDLPRHLRSFLVDAIEEKLVRNPVAFGKPLRYNLKGARRLRIGDYRAIFELDTTRREVTIIAIKHRKDTYEA